MSIPVLFATGKVSASSCKILQLVQGCRSQSGRSGYCLATFLPILVKCRQVCKVCIMHGDQSHCMLAYTAANVNQATSHCELPDIAEKHIIISFPKRDFSFKLGQCPPNICSGICSVPPQLRVLYTATHMHYYGMQLKPHYLIKTVVLL